MHLPQPWQGPPQQCISGQTSQPPLSGGNLQPILSRQTPTLQRQTIPPLSGGNLQPILPRRTHTLQRHAIPRPPPGHPCPITSPLPTHMPRPVPLMDLIVPPPTRQRTHPRPQRPPRPRSQNVRNTLFSSSKNSGPIINNLMSLNLCAPTNPRMLI